MTKSEAITFIKLFIRTATPEQLRNVICGIYSPLCSSDCPLKDKHSANCECLKIED